jgi:hypothetical protein
MTLPVRRLAQEASATGLSPLARMLDSWASPSASRVREETCAAAVAASGTSRTGRLGAAGEPLSAPQVLARIERAWLARDEAEAELTVLIDHTVSLGIGWPEIAARLRVSRRAARQHYQRRHRDANHQDAVA